MGQLWTVLICKDDRRHLDVNGDGRLSRSEVQSVIGSLLVVSSQEAQAAQEEVVLLAADGGDDIDFAGFLAFFLTVLDTMPLIPQHCILLALVLSSLLQYVSVECQASCCGRSSLSSMRCFFTGFIPDNYHCAITTLSHRSNI